MGYGDKKEVQKSGTEEAEEKSLLASCGAFSFKPSFGHLKDVGLCWVLTSTHTVLEGGVARPGRVNLSTSALPAPWTQAG